MNTKTKIIVASATGVFLIVILLIGIAAGGVYYLGYRLNEPELRAKLDRAWKEGEKFGKTTDQDGCMAKGLAFDDSPNIYDMSNADFDFACLRASRPSPNFCDGVELKFSGNWPEDQCRVGMKNREACVTAYESKLIVCRREADK